MIKQIKMEDIDERVAFVTKAARWFEAHPEHSTYTDGSIEQGKLFAVRWGADYDCMVVFRIHEYEDIENYVQTIDYDKSKRVVKAKEIFDRLATYEGKLSEALAELSAEYAKKEIL